MDAAARSRIADPSLAATGEQKIQWVAKHSPVLNRLARTRLSDGALRGRRVAVVVHLEAKTAYLALLLAEAGAQVVAAGSNPGSTQDAICAALVARGVEVHASHDASREQFDADLLAVADTEPELVVDDGAELTARILEHRPELAARLAGVTEETTTGVARLRAMDAAGKLSFPAIAANDARCKHLFDNRYGTGQSTLAAIDRLTNLNFAGREFCIVGYGWVGKGLARYAGGQGGRVTVVEIEPVAALEAHMDGHRVARLEDALPDADVVIAATGATDAVPADAIPLLKDGVLLANGGHHERELAIDALGSGEEVRPGVNEHAIPGGGRAYVLVDGRQTNVAGGDGHPVEIMDLSFSVQALAVHLLAGGGLAPGLHLFPAELDAEIARTKLATLGIELGEPTQKQREFSERWNV
ncbi:MAG: adenosylhomocysteinase [Actinobacteria bacterium]|nr:adenosylhomocysteinase [Actinomycetota bacterium]